MSNFVDDMGKTLPVDKRNRRAIPAGADPREFPSAEDWNAVDQAVLDIRDWLHSHVGNVPNSASTPFDGSQDFVDVTFATPFNANTYRIRYAVFITDDGACVDVVFKPKGGGAGSKSLDGMRIVPAARFTGVVDWEAKL